MPCIIPLACLQAAKRLLEQSGGQYVPLQFESGDVVREQFVTVGQPFDTLPLATAHAAGQQHQLMQQ